MEEYQKVIEIQTFATLLAIIKKIDSKDFEGVGPCLVLGSPIG